MPKCCMHTIIRWQTMFDTKIYNILNMNRSICLGVTYYHVMHTTYVYFSTHTTHTIYCAACNNYISSIFTIKNMFFMAYYFFIVFLILFCSITVYWVQFANILCMQLLDDILYISV